MTDAVSTDRIKGRAYEIYELRGGAAGHEQDDWLQAERELAGEQSRGESGRYPRMKAEAPDEMPEAPGPHRSELTGRVLGASRQHARGR